jgi:hypothetical protein
MARRLLAVLLLPVLGCAQPEASLTEQALADALASQRASLAGVGAPGDARAGAPAGTPVPAPAPASGQAVMAALRPEAGGTAPALAGELIGQTPEALRRLLGEPRLRRQEEGAEIWHYQASQCHLDLVLYPDTGRPGLLRVAFAQARAAGAARRGEAACLRDIARGAARPPPPPLTEQAAAPA